MNVVFISTECSPFATTGIVGDVVYKLAKDVEKEGHNVTIVIPRYGFIDPLSSCIERLPYELKVKHYGSSIIASAFKGILPDSLINVFFVESQNYFSNSKDIYLTEALGNEERCKFFSSTALEIISSLRLHPDIIHFFDSQTAYVSTLLNSGQVESFKESSIGTIFTICDMFDFKTFRNYITDAIKYSNYVTTLSHGYAQGLLSDVQNFGLSSLLLQKKEHFWGQTLGINEEEYNPENDTVIVQKYSKNYFTAGKKKCKEDLLRELNTEINPQTPLFAMFTRLNSDEGFDLIISSLTQLLSLNLQLIIHGSGNPYYEDELLKLAAKHKNLSVCLGYNDNLVKKICAGSDFFIYPKQFDSSGIPVLVAMKYGCIPIAHISGAMNDIASNGIIFKDYKKESLLDAISTATKLYKNKDKWLKLVKEIMSFDSNELNTTLKYISCYKNSLVVHENNYQ